MDKREYGLNLAMQQVIDFHRLFEYPVQHTPRRVLAEEKTFRINLMMEELLEYKEAETLENDVKELLDVIYFALGALMEHGISNPQELFNIIHEYNIKNRIWDDGEIHRREDGKILKRPDSVKPEPILRSMILGET